MTWEILLELIHNLLLDEGKHFLFSSLVGGSASCLTLIICYALSCAWERLTRRKMSTAAVFFTIGLCLLAGLSAALLSHAFLDGFSLWYVTPLGPPLQIDTGGVTY
jgi:hypothetical protein